MSAPAVVELHVPLMIMASHFCICTKRHAWQEISKNDNKSLSYINSSVLIVIDMKETLKSVSDVESGVKNLSEEQVKQQFHPFVESVARRQKLSGNPLPMEELIPLGEEGLLEAWRQYDPASGCKFVPYAVWFVRKAMERRLQ